MQAAKGSGLVGAIEFVIDLLDFQRDERGLVTTRSQFRALRALCGDAGVDLAKIGYTPALLDHAVAGSSTSRPSAISASTASKIV